MLGIFPRTSVMRWLAVGAVALSLSACANKEMTPEGALNGAGGKFGAATPGTQRDFTQNVGDIVYFTSDSVDLTPEATQTLLKQSQWLQQYPQFTITIEGHADERGSDDYNVKLSQRRADAVRAYLMAAGVAAERLKTAAFGKSKPEIKAQGAALDGEGHAQNRRVVFAPAADSGCILALEERPSDPLALTCWSPPRRTCATSRI